MPPNYISVANIPLLEKTIQLHSETNENHLHINVWMFMFISADLWMWWSASSSWFDKKALLSSGHLPFIWPQYAIIKISYEGNKFGQFLCLRDNWGQGISSQHENILRFTEFMFLISHQTPSEVSTNDAPSPPTFAVHSYNFHLA